MGSWLTNRRQFCCTSPGGACSIVIHDFVLEIEAPCSWNGWCEELVSVTKSFTNVSLLRCEKTSVVTKHDSINRAANTEDIRPKVSSWKTIRCSCLDIESVRLVQCNIGRSNYFVSTNINWIIETWWSSHGIVHCRYLPSVDWTSRVLCWGVGWQNKWRGCIKVRLNLWWRRCGLWDHVKVTTSNSKLWLGTDMEQIAERCLYFERDVLRVGSGYQREHSAWLGRTTLSGCNLVWATPCSAICVYNLISHDQTPRASSWRYLKSVFVNDWITDKNRSINDEGRIVSKGNRSYRAPNVNKVGTKPGIASSIGSNPCIEGVLKVGSSVGWLHNFYWSGAWSRVLRDSQAQACCIYTSYSSIWGWDFPATDWASDLLSMNVYRHDEANGSISVWNILGVGWSSLLSDCVGWWASDSNCCLRTKFCEWIGPCGLHLESDHLWVDGVYQTEYVTWLRTTCVYLCCSSPSRSCCVRVDNSVGSLDTPCSIRGGLIECIDI